MTFPLGDDRGVLRAIAEELDVIGKDPDGCTWALVRTTPELLTYLAEMDAATDGDEDTDEDRDVDDENIIAQMECGSHAAGVSEDDEDNGDFENDQCDDQPCFHGGIPGVTY